MKLSKRFSKSFLRFSVLLLIAFLMTGCLPDYFDGEMYSLPSPVLNSPTRGSMNSVGGSVHYSGGANDNESILQGKIFAEHGYTGDFFSVAGHVEAYQGTYWIDAVENMKGENLQFYGLSPQLNASLFVPVRKVRLGVYALAGPYWEFGEYHDWLEEEDEESLDYWQQDSDTQFVFNGGLLIEHIPSKDNIVSFKFGVNSPSMYNITTQIRSGRSIYTIGLSHAVSFNYGYVW